MVARTGDALMKACGAFCTAILFVASVARAALEISHVQHTSGSLDASSGEKVAIRFHISAPAIVSLRLWDGRDLGIRSIGSDQLLPAGEHELAWDGRDAMGRRVPPEAYSYTLDARAPDGTEATWDVTDTTGGDVFDAEMVALDAAQKVVRYQLAQPARVRIRLGLADDGPLLRTLIDWVPRAAGAHGEPWDGRDASGVLELWGHPSLTWVARAFSLPANTILVGPPAKGVELIQDLPQPRFERQRRAPPRARILDYPHQALETRRDFPLALELPSKLPRTSSGVPIIAGPLPVRLGVADADRVRILNERCEAVFFVDGRFVFENEVAFLPITWTWDPTGAADGEHFISANLRGYEGHFGMATVKVVVRTGGNAR